MFSKATADVREAVYGIIARTADGDSTEHSMGSGVMIAPNHIVTNSHILHGNGGSTHREVFVIRSPDIGKPPVSARLVKDDPQRDLALLQVTETPNRYVTLESKIVPSGTSCGSLGFPLSEVSMENGQFLYTFMERFQGAYISFYFTETLLARQLSWYEVDRVMYEGSSGCPFYLQNGKVIGLQTRVRTENDVQKRKLAISLCIPSTDIVGFVDGLV